MTTSSLLSKDDWSSEADFGSYHVVIDSREACHLVWPKTCLSCGSTEAVLSRRVETKAPRPGVHFMTWTGRSLRLPLCEECGTRLRNRLELPLLAWFFALPLAVGLLAFACGGRLAPFPGVILTALIAIPVWFVRCWQNRRPPIFDVTDFEDELQFT